MTIKGIGDYNGTELLEFLGNLTLMYMNEKAGVDSHLAFFRSHGFLINKEDDLYTFIIFQ